MPSTIGDKCCQYYVFFYAYRLDLLRSNVEIWRFLVSVCSSIIFDFSNGNLQLQYLHLFSPVFALLPNSISVANAARIFRAYFFWFCNGLKKAYTFLHFYTAYDNKPNLHLVQWHFICNNFQLTFKSETLFLSFSAHRVVNKIRSNHLIQRTTIVGDTISLVIVQTSASGVRIIYDQFCFWSEKTLANQINICIRNINLLIWIHTFS